MAPVPGLMAMRKIAPVFVTAVILPSLVLAWLAARSVRDQQFLIERQQSIICQGLADTGRGMAELRVLDRGLGVPPGCEEKIFEQFFRAHDNLNSGIPGSGLGLTLARELARAHGGEITYTPRPGGGSCFALRLPLALAAATPSKTSPRAN